MKINVILSETRRPCSGQVPGRSNLLPPLSLRALLRQAQDRRRDEAISSLARDATLESPNQSDQSEVCFVAMTGQGTICQNSATKKRAAEGCPQRLMYFDQHPSKEIPKALKGVKIAHHQDNGIQYKKAAHANKTTRQPPPASRMGRRRF